MLQFAPFLVFFRAGIALLGQMAHARLLFPSPFSVRGPSGICVARRKSCTECHEVWQEGSRYSRLSSCENSERFLDRVPSSKFNAEHTFAPTVIFTKIVIFLNGNRSITVATYDAKLNDYNRKLELDEGYPTMGGTIVTTNGNMEKCTIPRAKSPVSARFFGRFRPVLGAFCGRDPPHASRS